ncbi:MAG: hypothetical protein NUV47_02285 [Patescibacteria group bacterium]|nr:hypothetical protein [Patescibacteria group bacterium]
MIKKTIRYTAICLFFVIIVGYSFYQSRNIIKGPTMTIFEPENGAFFDHSSIIIQGQSTNSVEISINNRNIFIDENGIFKEKYLLSQGNNIITILAKDKFGGVIKKTLELVYE